LINLYIKKSSILIQQLADADVHSDAVLFLYLTASGKDIDWRKDCLAKKMSAGTFDALMGDVLRSQLLEHASELPWDSRLFGSVCRHNVDVEDSPANQDWIDLMETK
jgi:hypothetical protein